MWFPEIGVGWYPVIAQPYDLRYWERYLALDRTPCGEALTRMRREFVAKHWDGALVDVGIGGGKFVTDRPQTFGYDVNPHAVAWLRSLGQYEDPTRERIAAASFWDSLEHIHDPSAILNNIERFAFVSIPILKDCEDVLASKHFRRDEHCWYFTAAGLGRFMGQFGFACIDQNQMEQAAGREQIETFAFQRVRAA